MKILLLLTIAVFPFYEALPMIQLGEAEISVYDGLVMFMMAIFIFLIPVFSHRIKLVRFDYVVIAWVFVNSLVLLLDADNFMVGLNEYRYKVAIPVAFYFLIRFFLNTRKSVYTVCWVYLCSVGIMALLGIFEFQQTGERIVTTAGGPHAGGAILGGGVLLGWVLWKRAKRFVRKYSALLMMLLSVVGVLLVMGRVLIPALLIFPPLFIYLFRHHLPRMRLIMFGFLTLSLLTPLAVISYEQGMAAYREVHDRRENMNAVSRLEDIRHIQAGAGVRVPAYTVAFKYISDQPIYGYGFSINYKLHKMQLLRQAHTHNLMLDILLRAGIIGLLFFFWLMLAFISMITRSYRRLDSEGKVFLIVLTVLLFTILANGIGNNIANLATTSALWFYIGLAANIAASREWQTQSQSQPAQKTISKAA